MQGTYMPFSLVLDGIFLNLEITIAKHHAQILREKFRVPRRLLRAVNMNVLEAWEDIREILNSLQSAKCMVWFRFELTVVLIVKLVRG